MVKDEAVELFIDKETFYLLQEARADLRRLAPRLQGHRRSRAADRVLEITKARDRETLHALHLRVPHAGRPGRGLGVRRGHAEDEEGSGASEPHDRHQPGECEQSPARSGPATPPAAPRRRTCSTPFIRLLLAAAIRMPIAATLHGVAAPAAVVMPRMNGSTSATPITAGQGVHAARPEVRGRQPGGDQHHDEERGEHQRRTELERVPGLGTAARPCRARGRGASSRGSRPGPPAPPGRGTAGRASRRACG